MDETAGNCSWMQAVPRARLSWQEGAEPARGSQLSSSGIPCICKQSPSCQLRPKPLLSRPKKGGRAEYGANCKLNAPDCLKGRLPDGVGDQEIKHLSLEIEEAAHTSSSHVQDPVARKQAYYKAASKLLLEAVLDHCPPDADPTACMSLPPPQLEPQSALSSHVARPPMDPRQALSAMTSLPCSHSTGLGPRCACTSAARSS